jgi:signal transduction histidine kinase
VSVGVQGQAAVISIGDDGPGIPKDIMLRVFEPCFRVDPARPPSVQEAGLGLAIANEIAGRHGGKLTLQNLSPKGKTSRGRTAPGGRFRRGFNTASRFSAGQFVTATSDAGTSSMIAGIGGG